MSRDAVIAHKLRVLRVCAACNFRCARIFKRFARNCSSVRELSGFVVKKKQLLVFFFRALKLVKCFNKSNGCFEKYSIAYIFMALSSH